MKPLVLLLGGVLWGLPSLPDIPWPFHLPAAVERWLYNPRERTAQAIEASAQGHAGRAAELTGTALRLAAEDPLVRYNDGTAHLGAGHERKAVPLLEQAAREAGPDLSPAAHYNLGNARLAAGDAAGAVEAYKTALRAEPGNADAKFNLEIALREKERQRRGLGAPRQGQRGQRRDQRDQDDPSKRPGSGNPSESERQQDSQNPGQSPDRQGEGGEQNPAGAPSQQQQAQGDRPLRRYQDQPDMNAREAAALLAAVENLERQQRRDEAAQRARQSSAGGKDW
jgi:hypothetical protein